VSSNPIAFAAQPGRNPMFSLDMALVYGPRPADEALRTLDDTSVSVRSSWNLICC
jgi:hypothetical protein